MKPYTFRDPLKPLPANYVPVPNYQLNDKIINTATKILHDDSVNFGDIVFIPIDEIRYAFRKQTHGANIRHKKEHLAVSAFFHKSNLKTPTKYTNKYQVKDKKEKTYPLTEFNLESFIQELEDVIPA